MKATELRIGNWVKLQGVNRPIRVSIIDTTETSEMTKAEPIPLTEEILLKCGFKYREAMAGGQDEWAGYGFWSINGVHLLGHKNGEVLFYDRRNETEYKFLHQLQNLYYALKNEELQIELL